MSSPELKVIPDVRPRLGEILLERGNISKIDLNNALKMQSNRDALLGEIIVSHRLAKLADVESAIDIQFSGVTLDIAVTDPDPDLLAEFDPVFCLENDVVPWRKIDGQIIVAAANPQNSQVLDKTHACWPMQAVIVRADSDVIRAMIEKSYAAELTQAARMNCSEHQSCRDIGHKLNSIYGAAFVFLLALLVYLAPAFAFITVFFWAMLANIATMVLRGASLIAFLFGRDRAAAPHPQMTQLADFRKRPRVSVLLPLFHENRVLDSLLEALEKQTYPKELLDIKILLEEEDTITANALSARILPAWITVITVPKDILQTKPRAMNYALPFCKGDIVGIYDAEDRPDPDQIDKIVAHLMAASNSVGAVQCYLDFYNSKSNWIARCFTIEYAVWFRVIMRGLQRLGIPLPFGGTSIFMRRNVLEETGAWDAYNVTEDADLGIRMARFGYRCEVVNSTTWEEANNKPVAWVKQRSRWLKGFAMTWATHMRNPLMLLRELGLVGFFGFQVIFLGTVTAFLCAPLFWVIWTGYLGLDWGFFSLLPDWVWTTAFGFLIFGEIVMISIATVAMLLKRRPGLVPFILTLSLYWPLGTFAAYKALFELFFAPFYWDKTDHGLD